MHAAKAEEACYFVEEGTEVIGGEGKEKLLSELSIFEHAVLIADLKKHGYTARSRAEELDFDLPVHLDQLLQKKISNLLKKEKDQKGVSYLDKSKELLKKTPPEAQNIIQNVLWIVTMHEPTGAVVEYKDGKVKKIKFKEDDNVELGEVEYLFCNGNNRYNKVKLFLKKWSDFLLMSHL